MYFVVAVCCAFVVFGAIDCYLLEDDREIPAPMYYDAATGNSFRMTTIRNNLSSFTTGAQYLTKTVGKYRIFEYRSNGCSCQGLVCSCCAGFNMPQLNFNQEGCMSFGYDPNLLGITMNMAFNNNSVFSNSLSARHPPPICVPVPIPYLPGVDFCVKLFDIRLEGRNLHMCLDFQTRVQSAAILVLHFDCMRLGTDGISLVKPGQGQNQSTTTEYPFTDTDPVPIDSDIYDPLNENKYRTSV